MVKGKGYPESPFPVELNLFNRFYLSALVIANSLITTNSDNGGQTALEETLSQHHHIASTKKEIRFYLGELSRGVDRHGEMKLLFPGCLPFAAPFLLFRLKRSGFSNCRAVMTGEGLLLTAIR
jgi:hypothetical protein